MKERLPKHGAEIIISNEGGIIGEWRDSLYPDQAYLSCSCGETSYEIDVIDYWMGNTLPEIPEDK